MRVRKLEARLPGTVSFMESILEHLEAAEARGEKLEFVKQFFDFCLREPEVSMLIALFGGVVGRRNASEQRQAKESDLPN